MYDYAFVWLPHQHFRHPGHYCHSAGHHHATVLAFIFIVPAKRREKMGPIRQIPSRRMQF